MPNKQFQYQIERIPKITITTATTTTGQSTTKVTKRYNATVFNTTTKPIIKTNATAVTKKYISCYQIEIKKECSATNPYTNPVEQNWNKYKEYNYCVETYICQGKGNCRPANTLLNEARNMYMTTTSKQGYIIPKQDMSTTSEFGFLSNLHKN